MQQNQLINAEIDSNTPYNTPVKRKIKPRKWREIENVKAQMLLAKELQEIDSSYSFCQSELM